MGLGESAIRDFSSGSLRLDIALGTGGFPAGAMVELSGSQSSGKTYLCQLAAAEAQRSGGFCAWIDADYTYSKDFASRCGMHMDRTIYCAPTHTEMALWVLERLASSGVFTLIVLDSVAALVTSAELSGKIVNPPDALNEELLTDCLYRLARYSAQTGTIIIFTNNLNTRMSAVYHRLSEHPHRWALKLRTGIQIRLAPKFERSASNSSSKHIFRVTVAKNRYFPSLK